MGQVEFIEDSEKLCSLAPVTAAPLSHHVFVCTGKSCSARNSSEVRDAFEHDLKQRGILFGKEAKGKNPKGSIIVTECASVGFCSIGPTVLIYPDGVWYAQVQPKDVSEIIEEHLLNGRVVERLALMRVPSAPDAINDQQPDGGETNGGDWEA